MSKIWGVLTQGLRCSWGDLRSDIEYKGDEIFVLDIMDTFAIPETTLKIKKTVCSFSGSIKLMNNELTQSVKLVDNIFYFSNECLKYGCKFTAKNS